MNDAIDHGVLEAILFAAERPLSAQEIAHIIETVEQRGVGELAVQNALQRLGRRLEADGHGVTVAEVAGGFDLRTRSEHAPYIREMYKKRPVRLSRQALEVLAIVAYRQPCTRAQVDDIRGVDSSSTLRSLLERRLLKILGKADDVGRPLLYGTSAEFLSFFGLRSLTELPTLKEFAELTEEHLVRLQELDETLAANAGLPDPPARDAAPMPDEPPHE